jgi:hypothetical protein
LREFRVLAPEEKPIRPNQKDRREITSLRATMPLSRMRISAATTIMKICPNAKCSVFGHIVYTVVTRCPFCKWDLKSTLPSSEGARPQSAQAATAAP